MVRPIRPHCSTVRRGHERGRMRVESARRLPGRSLAMDEPDAASEPVPLSAVLEREYASLGRDPAPPPNPDETSRLRALFARAHADKGLSALCISGGGIRSATFALGALQELGRRGLLPQFDYLSTVSGGGYIGGWLTAWIHREGGIAGA